MSKIRLLTALGFAALWMAPGIFQITGAERSFIDEVSFLNKKYNLDGTEIPDLSDDDLRRMIETDIESLGSLSIGHVESGVLLNSVQMPPGDNWEIINPRESWGTKETIDFIQTALLKVYDLHPDAHPLSIGDISYPDGGSLNRHASHQAGRDADFGFFYKPGWGKWYTPGNSKNLDPAKNWTLVRALLVLTDVECILLDRKIQRILYQYALSIGEDKEWLQSIFQYPSGGKSPVIKHAPYHRTHYHIRFYNRCAQEMGRRAYPHLLELDLVKPPTYYVRHHVRGGQTLGHLAVKYRTSIRAIQRANSLKGTLIREGRTYRIPCRGGAAPSQEPIQFPTRKLPPFVPDILQSVAWY